MLLCTLTDVECVTMVQTVWNRTVGGHTQLAKWGDGKVIRLYREAWITCINMRAAANYRPAAEGAFYLNLSPMWAAAAVTCWSGHLARSRLE